METPSDGNPNSTAPQVPPDSTVSDDIGQFFRRTDWIAALVATVVSLGVYLYTLAPTVTLQDSGEFITASVNWGVPHPPGYPSWSILTWLFTKLPFGNVAWRVNLFSAVCGAVTNGLVALLISRSGASFLAVVKPFCDKLSSAMRDKIGMVGGIAGALLFSVSDVMWSQAVITEVYTLNAFFLVILMVMMFIWIHKPQDLRYLYWTAFWFGLGLTNHQTLAVIFPAFAVMVFMVHRKFFFDYLIACMLIVGTTLAELAYLSCSADLGQILKYCFNPDLPNFGGDGDLVKIAFRTGVMFAIISSAIVIAIFLRETGEKRSPWQPPKSTLDLSWRGFWLVCGLAVFVWVVALGAFVKGGVALAEAAEAKAKGNTVVMEAAQVAAARCQEIQDVATTGTLVLSVPLVLAALVIVPCLIARKSLAWKPILAIAAAFWIGLLFYCYMPISSSTNPPMNWGYCRVKEGIYHHITRGQYEGSLPDLVKKYAGRAVLPKYNSPPASGTPWTIKKYYGQINNFFEDLSDNFTLPLALLALVVFFYYRDLSKKDRAWMIFVLVLFFFLVPVMIKLLNPEFDKQTKEIQKVFFVLAHAVYSVWIGYGVVFLLGRAMIRWPGPLAFPVAATVSVLLWLAPGFLSYGSRNSNWEDADQRGHPFGYYFGHDMFEQHPGLKKLYPPMDRDSVLYGGTDPGRFVPTYMILAESFQPPKQKYPLDRNFDRRDVYIITQNALADNTYMNYIRDHYAQERPDLNNPATLISRTPWQRWMFEFAWKHMGRSGKYPKEPIWIPNTKKVEEGFQQYVNELRTRQAQPGENVRIEGGKVSIQGVQGVMAINGIISKMIFDANKEKHSFYVEESYVIQWMYPYLEPAMVIMKINKDPMPRLPEDKVKRDREFWDEYVAMLMADPMFHRDEDAQKSFSKLRTAIAGLYTWRGMNGQPELNAEAEYAYKQALTLCPDSPETNFRFVELLSRLERYDDAIDLLEKFRRLDPYNQQIVSVIQNVRNMKKSAEEQVQWEERYKIDPSSLDTCLHLIQAYAARGRARELDRLVDSAVNLPSITTNHLIQLAQLYAQQQRLDRVAFVLDVLTHKAPEMIAAWYDFTVVNSVLNRPDAALNALEQAVKHSGAQADQIRTQAKADQRLNPLRDKPRFKEIVRE